MPNKIEWETNFEKALSRALAGLNFSLESSSGGCPCGGRHTDPYWPLETWGVWILVLGAPLL